VRREPTDRIVEAFTAHFLRSGWFFGLLSVVVFGLLLLASVSWPLNRFVLTVYTRVAEIYASSTGNHEIGIALPDNSEIRVFGARPDGLPPELRVLSPDTDSIRLVATKTTLQRISLADGDGLVIALGSDGSVDLGILNNGSISLAISGSIQSVDQTGQRRFVADIERATEWNIQATGPNAVTRCYSECVGANFFVQPAN
jgi:hypothetical protein